MKLAGIRSYGLALTAVLLPAHFALMGISQCCTDPAGCDDLDGDDWTTAQGDCNDLDPNVNPAATEVCNGIDDNCNGEYDEGTTVTLYYDADADGYGSGTSIEGCAGSIGSSTVPGDCDDFNASINPGVAEVCNGIDENCNGEVDEGTKVTVYIDNDGDGYGSSSTMEVCPGTGGTSTTGDCNDSSASVHPGASDTCGDGVDQDCSGSDVTCGGGSTYTFTDTVYDDVSTTSLYEWFAAQSLSSSSYIYFSISGSSSYDGAWCSERADWYQSNYLTYAASGYSVTSGSWNKWYRTETGGWNGPTTASYTNFFGSPCDGYAYSWCSEWGVGGLYNGAMPEGTTGSGESYSYGWSSGANWVLTIKVGSDRYSACGF
jgi:hypothetical protein